MEVDARPPQKLSNVGNLSQNWRFWKKEFQTYMKITKGYEKPEDEQVAWLKNFIGSVGLDAFEKISFESPKDEENMTVVMEKLEQFFNPPKNEVEERHKFFSKSKKNNESIDTFIQDLMEQSKYCNFGDQTESLIRDVVVLDSKDKFLRKLFFEESDLNIEKLKIIYKTYEINSEKIKDVSKEVMFKKTETEKTNVEPSTSSTKKIFSKGCWKCGQRHAMRNCPAYRAKCVYCQQLNHFSHCCPVAKIEKVEISSVSNTVPSKGNKTNFNSASDNIKNKPKNLAYAPSAPSASVANLKYEEQNHEIPPSYSSLYPNLQPQISVESAHHYSQKNLSYNNRGQSSHYANSKPRYHRLQEKPKQKDDTDCTIQ